MATSPTIANAILSATDLEMRYGVQTVLSRATLAINEGDRIGLVGRNGTGKSTFLRIVAGVADPDAGQVIRRRELVTGYLPQDFQLDDAKSVEENILMGAQQVLDLVAEYEAGPADDARADELLDHINHLDGWDVEHRVKALITHLSAPDADRLAGSLSGGEKRRVALARALLARPDLLILDEPTNHLDTESIVWLEDFLKNYPGTCLFVTHDRYFLDRVADRIVELAGGNFISHQGNYTAFLEAKAARMANEEAQEAGRQKFLKRELEWVRRGAPARTTKSRERMDRYAALAGQAAPEQELDVDLIIPPAPKMANRIIELKEAGFDLPDGRTLFDGLNLNLDPGQRLGIVGRNGMGKTTLLKVMLGQLAPTRGEALMGTRTIINYVDQGRLLLDEEKTVMEEVGEGSEWVRLGEEQISVRGYLGRFLFSGERGELENPAALGRRAEPGDHRQDSQARRQRHCARRADERSRSGDVAHLGRGAHRVRRRGGGGQSRPVFSQPGVYVNPGVRGRRADVLRRGQLRRLRGKNAAAPAPRPHAGKRKPRSSKRRPSPGPRLPPRGASSRSRKRANSKASKPPSSRRKPRSGGWRVCSPRRIFISSTARAGRRRKTSSPRPSRRSRGCTHAGRNWKRGGRRRARR